jgi:outer membrane protein TolC
MKEKADVETYGIIESKSPAVPGMEQDFSIEQDTAWNPLEGLPKKEVGEEALGQDSEDEIGAAIISLEKALEIAVRNSRTYQNNKESLYLSALGLTLDRHLYTPIFAGGANATYGSVATIGTKPTNFAEALATAGTAIGDIEAITGTPATLLRQYANLVNEAGVLGGVETTETDFGRDETLSGGTSLGVTRLLRGGGQIALGFSTNFLRFLTGSGGTTSSSALVGSLTQPLLRGAGSRVGLEQLTQAERDVLYALRDFTIFRQDFTVQVCSNYYSVLGNRDRVRNDWRSYQNFLRSVARQEAMTRESRSPQVELDRLRQEQLSSEDQWINSVRAYRESLDQYKILLGLSTDAHVVLNDTELEVLRVNGLEHPMVSAEDAVQVAMVTRLDLYNAQGRVEDSERQIEIAENAFLPRLDLVVDADVPTVGDNDPIGLRAGQTSWNAGLDLELPLDLIDERNAYRASLISHERALRDHSLAVDTVKFDVRAGWRDLDQARRNYEINQQGVALNERRVLHQELLAELGLAVVQDIVDAQNDLNNAQNNLTQALVNHTISRLEFWRDMGILYIKKNGQWEEVSDDIYVAVKPGTVIPEATPPGETPAPPPASEEVLSPEAASAEEATSGKEEPMGPAVVEVLPVAPEPAAPAAVAVP